MEAAVVLLGIAFIADVSGKSPSLDGHYTGYQIITWGSAQ